MYLDIFTKNGNRYIRISETVRVQGKTNPTKRTIATIGAVSKFDDGKPDFEKRLKDSFKACDPIIPELKPYVKKELPKEIYHLSIHEGTNECIGHPKLFASCLFDKIFEEIGLKTFVGSYKNYDGITYDVQGFLKLALYGRILNPQSKFATILQNSKYYTPIIDNDAYVYNIYDMLDFVSKHKEAIFNRIDGNMRKKYGRTTNKIYYDVTNFFFDIDKQDRYVDESGEIVLTGVKQEGVSKEHSKNPIVQMGLLMDEQGYPVSIEMFPGNTLDHLTLKKSFENGPEYIKSNRYIFVSDKGIGKGDNPKYAVSNGNGYITSKSVAGSTKNDKEWILEEDGYTYDGPTFKYKSRIIEKKYKLDDGTELKSSEKQVTYWSKKFFDKEYHEKEDYYNFLKKLIEHPENFRISKLETNVIKKYFKKDYINKKSGEMISKDDLRGIIDIDKIKEEYKLLGYYTIVSSETNMEDKELIETYHELVKIEDEFRIMKSTLDTRPIFVRTDDHIKAHLSICTLALLFLRIIQNKVKSTHKDMFKDNEMISAERIRAALNEWEVDKLADEYYRFNNIDNDDLALILDSFGIKIDKKLYRIGDLKHIKQTIENQSSANL